MFTGLIQAVGQVQHKQSGEGDLRLRIAVGGLPMDEVQLGESIAVSGVCLTVVEFGDASLPPMSPMKPCPSPRLAGWPSARRSIWNAPCCPPRGLAGTW